MTMHSGARIYIAGHRGLAGSAMVRDLRGAGYSHLLMRTHGELELTDRAAVERFFVDEDPEFVIIAAAKVGGIAANSRFPVDFLNQNLAIEQNLIEASHRHGVKRLLLLGSSCIYPRDCPQPIREEYLLSGPLEPTNRPYAIAKIAGIEMCWSFNRQFSTHYLAVMPPNLYGPNDNFDPETSHVLAALIRKAVLARIEGRRNLAVWGSGTPRREFMHADDLAAACRQLLESSEDVFAELTKPESLPIINAGSGEDITIRDLAATIAREAGLEGEIIFDRTKPDGTPRKLLDTSRMRNLGWRPQIQLDAGIRSAISEFKKLAAIEREPDHART